MKLRKQNQAGREKTKQSGFLLAPHNVILFESLISNHAKNKQEITCCMSLECTVKSST